MRKIALLCCVMLCTVLSKAQLTGTKNIPGAYPDLATAITDLNTQGVGAGGVTLNLLAGNPQTAPAGGYSITATGTLANQITIQGNANVITASAALTVGNLNDAIFKLIGADYVTLTGFTMQENAGNTVTAAATNNMTEWGVALLYTSATDGAQNNTISGNTISLNRTYTNTCGVYSNVRHSATAVTTLADITNNTTAPNSGNKIYTNAISNVNVGVVFIGSATAANMDVANDIGGSSLSTGNTFTNWGGAAPTSVYVGLPTTVVMGAYINDENNINLSFNSFISASFNTATGLRGILIDYAAIPTGTITDNVNNNIVTMTQAGAGGFQAITSASTAGAASNVTMNMNNNSVINSAVTGAASAITIFGVANLGAFGTVSMSSNIFTGNTSSATTGGFIAVTNQGAVINTINLNSNQVGTAALGAITFSAATTAQTNLILNTAGAATATVNINNNIISGLSYVTSGQISALSNQSTTINLINIKDNFIGTATTNAFTFSGAQSSAVLGVFNAGGAATGLLTITGNDIRGINHVVTGSAAHTYYLNQTYTGATVINNNTFTNITANTTGSITFISNNVSHAASTNHTCNNNSIVTGFNKTGAGGTVQFFISNSASPSTVTETSSNNNFSNVTVTGATTIAGWQNSDGGTPVTTVTNNTFNNIIGGTSAITVLNVAFSGNGIATGNTISNVSGAGNVTGISSASGIQTFSGNTISNLSSSGASSTVLGISISGGTTQTVSGNTINTLSGSGITSPLVRGISVSSGTTVNVYKNKIYDLTETGVITTTAGAVNGLIISGGTTVNAYNNIIGDLKAPAANLTDAIRGINITSATASSNLNVSYNTIFINASSTGANFGTSGLFHTFNTTATTAALNLNNNIIVNNSVASGTGLTVAFRRSASTNVNNYGATSNNNLFYAGTPGANNLIYNDGTNSYQTLAAYKAAMLAPRDNVSVTENPSFVSTVGSNATFLHINTAIATQVESAAATIAGITDDFDGDVRNVSTPDIGADEGNFISLDLTGPAISYATLGNTLCTTSRTISATISDPNGVNITAGNKPRIWFKKATNANALPGTNTNTTDGWKYAEASNATSPFNLTIDPTLIFGGVAGGDVIQYFVVAQDNAGTPNISINAGTFAAAPAGVALTAAAFPIGGTINSYTINAGGLSGTVTVGPSGTYPSLTGAGGLFAAINGGGLNGNVTATIVDPAVAETGATALNAVIYGCAGPYTLTIKPATGVTTTLTGSATSIIKLNGASNVIIDGSNNGTNSQNMTIINNQITTSAIIWNAAVGGAGNGANNNTFKNLILVGGSGTASTIVGIANAATSSITTAGDDNNNLTIQNCSISKVLIGIEAIGTTGLPQNGLTISGNSIGSNTAANYLQYEGIQLSNAVTPIITLNTIFNIKTTTLTTATTGIDVGAGVIGGQITRNNITGIYNQNTGQWASYGINFSSSTGTTNVTVANNFISDIQTVIYTSSTTWDAFGIRLTGGTNLKIYNNTVNLFGNITLASGTGFSADLLVTSTLVTGLDLRNNIFVNTMTFAATASVYNVYMPSGFTFGTSNYNDYYGTSGAGPSTYYVGYNGTANQSTLANWQTAYAQDAQSQSVAPIFVSSTDLHLSNATVGANWCLNSSGVAIAGITNDIDGDVRNTPPDLGADEFNVTGDAVATPASQTVCSGTAIAAITYTGTGTTFTWTRDNTATATGMAASGAGNITGTLTNTTSAPVTVTFTITAYNASGCTGATFTATVLVNPSPVAIATPASQTACSGTAITPIVLSSLTTGTTYTWTRDNTATVTGIAANGAGDISGTLTNTTTAPITVTFTITPTANGCVGTPSTATVLVNVGATITPIVTEPTTCVSTDGAITLVLSGVAGPYTFAWTGTGVNPTAQNQTGLVAGVYNVTVTAGNGCQSSAVIVLNGPGGCSICPIIGSVTTNPTPTGCIGSPITLTASGLTSMGVTYGIIFKSFTAIPADPYIGGTVLATVPNGALTTGGTIATGTGTFAAANTYFVYAILTPTPLDPLCRPSASTNFVINPTPTAIATPASQTTCSGTAITTIALSGAVGGTTYNWTRNNTATVTGIAATGAGDIAGTLTNTTAAPVTVTFTITPTAGGCFGTPITATVLVNPTPTVTATPTSQSICSGATITTIVNSGSAVAGTTYSWTRNNTATVTGIAANGTGNISGALTNNTAAAVTVTFTITPVANGCAGTPVTATVLVNPTTTAVATPASQTICSGSNIVPIVITGVAGTTFTWTRNNTATVPGGIPASGSGSTISGFMINTTTAPVTVTFTITPTANGCPGTPTTATVVVNPFATAIATPVAQTACSGSAITTIALTSNVPGATYTWTRDNTATATGIAASGTGNIAGTLTLVGTAPVTVTFTITPSFGGCPGPSITASVTINPTPTVNQPANQTLCNGSTAAATAFTGSLAGITYSWTNNTPSIGLAASGTGNIAAFTATNAGITPVTATITVTPSLNGCTGTPKTFTITVNPSANVNAIGNQTMCTGAATTAVTFAGTVAGTTFTWTNSAPSIGLAASGTGNIASFTAVNNTPNAVTATITVTPTATGCAGTSKSFTITVNGQSVAPTGATASNIALCGAGTADLSVQGGALGTGASWKWYSGSCGGTLIGTGATITAVPVAGTATFYVRAEGTCNTTACASVTVTVNPQPTITLSAAPYTSLMFPMVTSITANINPSAANNTIVWYKAGVPIAGATTNVLGGITVDQLGTYSARVTTASGCTALSAPITIKDSASDKIFILPNPNNGQFKIRYYTPNISFGFLRNVTIYDSKGAQVYTKAIPITGSYSAMDIDIRKAGHGLFLVVVADSDGKKLITAKVEVQ